MTASVATMTEEQYLAHKIASIAFYVNANDLVFSLPTSGPCQAGVNYQHLGECFVRGPCAGYIFDMASQRAMYYAINNSNETYRAIDPKHLIHNVFTEAVMTQAAKESIPFDNLDEVGQAMLKAARAAWHKERSIVEPELK